MTKLKFLTTLAAGVGLLASVGLAAAQDVYKIGISAGNTGYLATIDNAWVVGVELAAEELNKKGGILGRKVVVVSDDNKSEPQEAIKIYQKMINSDEVNVFASGCLSAGNLAAGGLLARAEIPMVVCSILPKEEDHYRWAFSTLPPPLFEVETRLAYLRDHTDIRKIGVIYDPSPYAKFQEKIARDIASKYEMELVGSEQYEQKDADMSVQLSKLHNSDAGAILKMGAGATTLTAANNIKQLGLGIPLLTSLEDLAVFAPAAEILGEDFMFVAAAAQVPSALPEGDLKTAIDTFLASWKKTQGDRDPNWAGRGWDAVMLVKRAVEAANSVEGAAVRDALEKIQGYQGTTGVYNMSPTVHQGLTENPLFLARIKDGKVEILD